MPAFVDHYAVLGVAPTATPAEIRQAFRRAVHRHHADRHPGDAAAAERMRRIVAARDVLCDPERRARFDRVRAARYHRAGDPLVEAAARTWGRPPPSDPPRPPPVRDVSWVGAVVVGATGLAAALGLSWLAAAGLARSLRTRDRR
ncbi:MAG TPA: J domain-containing protein [Nannocystis sp.]